MKKVRFKYMLLLIFTFLFANLLSINVSRVEAEEAGIDLTSAYRGEIRGYWALVNYGEDYVGEDSVTIFLDPEAIENTDVTYILISEFNEYGELINTYFKRGVDSSFASRFTYTFVNSNYGKKHLTMFLLKDLKNEPSSIIDRINITELEKVRTIKDLTSADFVVYPEVSELTNSPYRVYVEIRENPQDYILKEIIYSYTRINENGEEEVITGSAISDPINHRYYFIVSENGTYHITIEDHFGYLKPDENDSISITIDNFYGAELILVPEYDNKLTNDEVPVFIKIYDGAGREIPWSDIEVLEYAFNGVSRDITNLGVFSAKENGVYTIYCRTKESRGSLEATIEVNITNIDTIAPVVFVADHLNINSSDVEKSPYVFDPFAYVLATDNASLGDMLTISAKYYEVSPADDTCKTYQGNEITENVYRYLYGVNDACVEFEVTDEAGNSRSAITKIIVADNTIPTISYSAKEIILQIGDDMPTNDELIERFGLIVDDNSRLFDITRPITITSDLSDVNLEELGRYEVRIHAIDASGNESVPIALTVTVTIRILVIDAVANQYIVYGEEMTEILYTCNGNPCVGDVENSEILPADWDKLTGELYIVSGARYSGTYAINSSLTINSKKYRIVEGTLGLFTIKPRTFKIIANSYEIDYKDPEPTLTWYMDTSVCNDDLSTKYTSFDEINYSCTFVEGDDFGGGSYVYSYEDGVKLYAGGITREEGNTVRYDASKHVIYYKITVGNLKVLEQTNGGRDNYYLDFYGLYDEVLYEGYARFYIYPKYVEVTMKNVSKVYGESDPYITYRDNTEEFTYVDALREDRRSNIQYEFTCFAYKYPINEMTTAECQQEIQLVVTRENGENVGRYKIIGTYLNENYDVRFNTEHESGPIDDAYLSILKRNIEMTVDGKNGDGKYTIFYEDALPVVTISITSDPSLTYEGLANNAYLNINDNSIISFADRLSYGDHRVKYVNSNGVEMKIVIGGYSEYIDGVGRFSIERDTTTILNASDEDVLSNYNLTFNEGVLEVLARQIYIKIVEGLNKIYGDLDPVFTDAYIVRHYGEDTNYIVDGSGHYILQIINTLENSDIVEDDKYEPFDKSKLKYYLKRSNIRIGVNHVDVHDGEMVGSYLVDCDYFENDTNYIIDIYQEYHFVINKRTMIVSINSNVIEFNYNNIVPKFSYSYENAAFTDALVGQPSVAGFNGAYRNNGTYIVNMGEILALSNDPTISSIGNEWYINGENTGVTLSDFPALDLSLITIIDSRYHIIDVDNNTNIDTYILASETNVMWNYDFEVYVGFLDVVPRNVIIVPQDGLSKQYGENDIAIGFKVKHAGDMNLEAILDSTDFTGELSRNPGEKPGLYQIIQNTLTPAEKGVSYNFNIVGFETNHYFEITKRILIIKHAASDDNNTVTVFYGDSSLDSIVNGYKTIEGSEALNLELCTNEIVNGVNECSPIYDKIVGGITTDPENPEDVGTYIIKNKDLRLVRVLNEEIDVSEYYELTFIEAELTILPRIIYVRPDENQSKIYGESDGAGDCGITYTYTPNLVKASDVFSGCLKRESKTLADGTVTSEAVGEYKITLGDLNISPNYQLILDGSVMYQIRTRNIVITANVYGEYVVQSANMNFYTMTYGNEYTLGYIVSGMGLANNPSLGIEDSVVNNVELSPEYNGVGTYLVVQGKLTVTNSRNYNITFVKATFVVQKRQVSILPNSLTKVYGDRDPNTFTFTFVNDPVEYTGSLTRLPGENVGKYRIIEGDLNFGENYEINLLEAYFEIVPRSVYVVADEKSKVYGFEDPEFTYTYNVEDDFELDAPFLGMLSREEGENVGVYQIIQNTLSLTANYAIEYTPANFTIYYVDFSSIEIFSLTNNKYQTQGEESEVRLYARFNKGADESKLSEVSWSIVKNNTIDINFFKDTNNIISFTPSESLGVYVVTAAYNGVSATYEVIVRTNNITSIYVSLVSGNVNQTLGLETEVVYSADVHMQEEKYDNVVIEWYAGGNLVCEKPLSQISNYCAFTPNLEIGTHKVYAKINTVSSNELDLIIKDNATPKITLVDQGVTYFIEAFQNATENSILFIEPGYEALDDVDGNITSKVVVRGVENINYYKVGTYYIIYEVSDNHGHVANNFRTIIVQDTVAPVVKLNNPELSEIILEYGDEYTEYGAVANDAYDDYYGKQLTVYIDSNLNINKVGTYEVIYFAVDSNGLRGQITRVVRVQDSVKPTITLIGDDTIYIEYKNVYKDPGAWFDDNYDGRYKIYPSTIVFTKEGEEEAREVISVDTSMLGIYRLTYYQEDTSGNAPENSAVRTVVVRDSTPPVITLLGSNPYILRYGTTYVDPGYKVIDNYDGDITDNTELVTVKEIIGDTLGTYYVFYNAKDTHNNIALEVKREVIVLDLVSPIIYFTDKCPQYITIEALDPNDKYDPSCNLPGEGYRVVDDYVPDIDAIQTWVDIDGEVDETTVGVYEIKYNVSDRSGNKAVTLIRYISVVDTTPPVIELKPNSDGDINFYVEVFSEYNEPGWSVSDIYDDYHGLEVVVTTTHNIKLDKLNTYTVTYIATDTNGNVSDPVYREITVRDTVAPILTLIGDDYITLERGMTRYAEYGATAKDNYDGVIDPSNIVITGAPTGNEYGEFEVKYCAKDSSGNEGCISRFVMVDDTIAPTVLGVEDGKYYRAPLYIYFEPLTGTDEILTGTLNGKLISNPWYVSKEGVYDLIVRDDADNVTEVHFVIDMTPPKLYGANDGEYLNHPVNIYSDEELMNITYRVNNGGFVTVREQNVIFETEGQFWVYATDMAGNASQMISFVIDMTPPIYSLGGVLNGGITDTDVQLVTENDVIVSVNNVYIPTNYTFTENGYYKVTIRDVAGNDVFLQFVINKKPSVIIGKETVTFISQNNAIDQFVAKAGNYPKSSGFIYAKPLLDGRFEYISGTLFSDEEYTKLINGQDLVFDVPDVEDDEMIVAFIVTLDELNKFTTQTVEGDDDSAIIYAIVAVALAAGVGGFFYFFVILKRKKEEEDEEVEVIEEDNYYY